MKGTSRSFSGVPSGATDLSSISSSSPGLTAIPSPERSLPRSFSAPAHLTGSKLHPYTTHKDVIRMVDIHDRQCARTPTKATRDRKNHDQSWLCRPWSRRFNGAGRFLLEPYRLHPNGNPQPTRTSRRGGQAVHRPKKSGSRSAEL